MIKVGITEGDSEVAGELIRLLVNHPEVDIVFVHSQNNHGVKLADIHRGLFGYTDLKFENNVSLQDIDLLFCCNSSGVSKFISDSDNQIPSDLKIIDFSDENRLKGINNNFVYGLPELNRRATCSSQYVSNPGSVATCVSLGLLPLAKHGLVFGSMDISVFMGRSVENLDNTSNKHIPISLNNSYNDAFLEEVMQSLSKLQKEIDPQINMMSYSCNFDRGVMAIISVEIDKSLVEITEAYQEYYSEDSFVYISDRQVDLLDVINTNMCVISIKKENGRFIITSCIDNMIKGASGQAVHNMNLMFNLEEMVGLQLKV